MDDEPPIPLGYHARDNRTKWAIHWAGLVLLLMVVICIIIVWLIPNKPQPITTYDNVVSYTSGAASTPSTRP